MTKTTKLFNKSAWAVKDDGTIYKVTLETLNDIYKIGRGYIYNRGPIWKDARGVKLAKQCANYYLDCNK